MSRLLFHACGLAFLAVGAVLAARRTGTFAWFWLLGAAAGYVLLRRAARRAFDAWQGRRVLAHSRVPESDRRRLAAALRTLAEGHPDVAFPVLDRLASRPDASARTVLARDRAALRLVGHPRFGGEDSAAWAAFSRGPRPAPHLERALLAPALRVDERAVAAEAAGVDDATLERVLAARRRLLVGLPPAVARPWHWAFPRAEQDLERMFGRRFLFLARGRLRRLVRGHEGRRALPAREEAVLLLLGAGRATAAAALLAGPDAQGRLTPRARALRTTAIILAFLQDGGSLMVSPELFARRTREIFFLHTHDFGTTWGSEQMAGLGTGPERLLGLLREKRQLVRVLAGLWRRRPALAPVLAPVVRRVAGGSGPFSPPRSARRFQRWWRRHGRALDRACGYNLRGLAILEEGRPAEAAGEFERALILDPWFAAAAFNLACARDAAGLRGEDPAEPLRRVAEAAGPESRGWLLLGDYLEEDDRIEEAENVYRRLLHDNPMHAEANLACGRVLARQGRLGEAEELLRRALAARDRNPDTLMTLATVHLESARPEEAIPLLAAAIEETDGSTREQAQYLLHIAHRDAERHDDALAVLDRIPDRFLRRSEELLEETAGYLEERRRYARSQRLYERLRELRARRGRL